MEVRNRYKSDRSDSSYKSDESDPYSIKKASPEVAANTLICLINQPSLKLRLGRPGYIFIEKANSEA